MDHVKKNMKQMLLIETKKKKKIKMPLTYVYLDNSDFCIHLNVFVIIISIPKN